MLPSKWSAVDLLYHLAIDVERFWFRAVQAADPEAKNAVGSAVGEDDAWHAPAGMTLLEATAFYRGEFERSNVIVAETALDTPPAWWPDFFGEWRLHNLHEIMFHVITETACHAGHADATRELIDGRQWLALNSEDF
jgi:hypothetical protein